MNFIHDLKYFLINKTKDILIYYYLKVVYSLYGTPSPPVLLLPWALALLAALETGVPQEKPNFTRESPLWVYLCLYYNFLYDPL